MSVAALLDQECTIWRPTESVGTLRSVDRAWDDTGRTGVAIAIQVRTRGGEILARRPGGELVTSQYLAFLETGADVEEGDIIEHTAGPGAFGFLEVHGKREPRGDHIELDLRETGEDPTAGST